MIHREVQLEQDGFNTFITRHSKQDIFRPVSSSMISVILYLQNYFLDRCDFPIFLN